MPTLHCCEMDPGWQPRTGAAQRRKRRRLRAAWRHEQQSIAQAVAEARHHPTGQKTATAEDTNNALRSQKTSVAGDTKFELGGTRSDRLAGVRPQVRVLQRTVEQIVDPMPVVQQLHDVEPQMEEQLVDVLSFYDLQVHEQGIEVPKIILEDISSRSSCHEPQLAEQLCRSANDSPLPQADH